MSTRPRFCTLTYGYRGVQTESGLDYSMTRRTYKELAGACLWLAAKADGSRACLPSRGLMAMGLNVDPVMLADTELVRSIYPSLRTCVAWARAGRRGQSKVNLRPCTPPPIPASVSHSSPRRPLT